MFIGPDEIAFMTEALQEARLAAAQEEVPVGAVAVVAGNIVARGFNQRESKKDPLSHAELEVVRQLVNQGRGWRLEGVTLYVTLEPCLMCMGALIQARLPKLVYGAKDPKAGACGSVNHEITVVSGVLEQECASLLKDFFRQKRQGRSVP